MPDIKPKKRLVFCFDGTSNTLDTATPTNVAITASSIRNTSGDVPQIVYYDEGVGSTKRDRASGGMFGQGLYQNVMDAYKFLVFNYEPHDEIFIFGFSRGAYTARSFAGLIHNLGVVNSCYADKIAVATALYRQIKDDSPTFFDQLNAFRETFVPDVCANADDVAWRKTKNPDFDENQIPLVTIKYIGVWDTVKTLGSTLLDDDDDRDGEADDAEFHDHDLRDTVVAARHAVAIDERRGKFDVTLWKDIDAMNLARNKRIDDPDRPYQQVWFPGTHGSVGGGGDIRGLSDEALEWVLEGAKRQGLKLDTSPISKVYGIRPDVLVKIDNSSKFDWNPIAIGMRYLLPRIHRVGPAAIHEVSRSAIVRWAAPKGATPEDALYRPEPLEALAPEMDAAAAAFPAWAFELRGGYAEAADEVPATVTDGDRTFRRHWIAPNERLDHIAAHYLGGADREPDIVAANPTTILDPDRYYAQQVINIPMA